MSHLTPDQVLVTPAGELAELSSESLFKLKNDAADLLAAAKAIVKHVGLGLGDACFDLLHAGSSSGGENSYFASSAMASGGSGFATS